MFCIYFVASYWGAGEIILKNPGPHPTELRKKKMGPTESRKKDTGSEESRTTSIK